MTIQSIILTILATAPPETLGDKDYKPAEFSDRLAVAELTASDGDAQIVGFDHDGEPIASLSVWLDDGVHHLEIDFDDGYASTIVVDGRAHTTTNLSDAVLAERARLIADRLRTSTEPQNGKKTKCAKTLALAGTLCAPLIFAPVWAVAIGIVSCPAGIIEAWCQCGDALGYKTGADVCD